MEANGISDVASPSSTIVAEMTRPESLPNETNQTNETVVRIESKDDAKYKVSDEDTVEMSAFRAQTQPKSLLNTTQETARQRYAFRALFRKTVSYQKRQTFTNVCCIALCPLLMVFLCWLLGFIIQLVLNTNMTIYDYMYCSNSTGGLDSNNFPLISNEGASFMAMQTSVLPSIPKSQVPFAKEASVYLANYYNPPLSIDVSTLDSLPLTTVPGNPCAVHFSPNYRYRNSDPYSIDPQLQAPNVGWSTASWPNPLYGWLNGSAFLNQSYLGPGGLPINIYGKQYQTNITSLYNLPNAYAQAYLAYIGSQSLPWYQIYTGTGVSSSLIGSKASSSAVTSFGSLATDFFSNANATSGLFDTLPNFYYSNLSVSLNGTTFLFPSSIPQFINGPYTSNMPSGSNNANTQLDMDNQLYQVLTSTFMRLKSIDIGNLSMNTLDGTVNYLAQAFDYTTQVPYGAILVEQLDFANKQVSMLWQVGNDKRLISASTFPLEGFRRLYTEYITSNSILRTMGAQQGSNKMAATQISPSLRAFPNLQTNKLSINVGSYLGVILYPYGVSFLLPIIVYTLVKEKESRILAMMRMNGLSTWVYYITHLVHFYTLHFCASFVFIVAGVVARLSFFSETKIGVLIILFVLWGFVQIALAFVLSTFFNRSRSALIVSFLLVLGSVVLNTAATQLYSGNNSISDAYLIWPPFAFYRAIVLVNQASYLSTQTPYSVSMLKPGNPVFLSIMFMIWQFVLLAFLAFYFNNIIQSEFGVAKPWYFIFSEPYKWFVRWYNRKKGLVDSGTVSNELLSLPEVDKEVMKLEDDDVRAERERVLSVPMQELAKTNPLVLKRVKKVYNGTKTALKDVTFALESGIIFGLLGPNGAGKSTLISILTGLYPATQGELYLAGYSVNNELDQVYQHIGVCPQHDIVWDDLTVEEHLLFYARLKGVPHRQEKQLVDNCLTAVSLQKFRDKLSKQLSGGTKRRLSIAMALVGDPKVVFLDEPTTGLDPEVRRLIWTIINMAKQDKTIVLTTHSMEEADVLCQRIGIIAKGSLRCIGPQARLKQLYGDGFRLSLQADTLDHVAGIRSFCNDILPGNYSVVDCFATSLAFEFKLEHDTKLYAIVDKVQENAEKLGIQDWGMAEASLEQVFLKLISQEDAEAVLDENHKKDKLTTFYENIKAKTIQIFRPPKTFKESIEMQNI